MIILGGHTKFVCTRSPQQIPQVQELILAKEIATLDHLTNGKVELGIGVGWLKEEFEALGVPWERRGARTDEYVEALHAVWSGTDIEFHGEFVDFDPLTCTPRPKQEKIPILVGGDTPAAIRRAAKLADGYYPGTGDFSELQKLIADVRHAAEDNGRNPAEIEINAHFSVFGEGDRIEGVEKMREAGVGRIMVPGFIFGGPSGMEQLQEFGESVVLKTKAG